ncbi:hypothetical protein AN639_06280 [Candidatus Epulonipiscium fishelsonii]|uniref:Uncharacterized protein n=1 Tax=Candidatus Epulonipiscium fishelsonii TaxID=77094 RepID=A0ACC8XAW3_9FIRM|nr:hypothetical protein AN639_06280 [Epulopiscium sp. SCG-B05WGA-EpuloA1]ONI39482.1 hypothetical protein AN396_08755 [Epulopiscium sp. SCG-B11WGA-EpuloA1]
MNTTDILKCLKDDIHSTIFSTIAEDGFPQSRAIDIMLCDEKSIYFITAKGKKFYDQLMEQHFVAIAGVKNGICINLRGKIRIADKKLLKDVFEQNQYMKDIYPGNTREILEVFQLYEGHGEYFDLNQTPIYRQSFSLGGAEVYKSGYVIKQENCLHCGSCYNVCPTKAIEKI